MNSRNGRRAILASSAAASWRGPSAAGRNWDHSRWILRPETPPFTKYPLDFRIATDGVLPLECRPNKRPRDQGLTPALFTTAVQNPIICRVSGVLRTGFSEGAQVLPRQYACLQNEQVGKAGRRKTSCISQMANFQRLVALRCQGQSGVYSVITFHNKNIAIRVQTKEIASNVGIVCHYCGDSITFSGILLTGISDAGRSFIGRGLNCGT
jgi:hypothetical protein